MAYEKNRDVTNFIGNVFRIPRAATQLHGAACLSIWTPLFFKIELFYRCYIIMSMKSKEIFNILKQKITPAKIFLFITLCLVVFVRMRLLSMPLDRDEGCWAYGGWLLLEGNPPYKYFYEIKMPGIYFLYAFIMMIFGQTTEGIRTGILFAVLINMFLVYKLSRKISGDTDNSLLSSSFYGLLSLDRGTLSLSGYTTHFVLTFVMLSVIFALDGFKQNKSRLFFISGLFAGISFMMKQPAIFFILFFLAYIFIMGLMSRYEGKKNLINILLYLAGSVSVFLIVCAIMKINGAFDRFWFMTMEYAFKHGKMLPAGVAISSFMFFLSITSFFFKVALFFLVLYVFFAMFFIKETDKKILYATLLLFSVAFVSSGFYFRNHYFIALALPMALVTFEKFTYKNEEDEIISKRVKNLLFIFFITLLLITQNKILFKLTPAQVCREIFSVNPFPESEAIAKFVASNTNKDDKIAVLGSESQIFFYAKRKSATGYTSFIHLMEDNVMADKMQAEAIREIEESAPKYLIYVNIPTSWVQGPKSSMRVFNWFKNKVRKEELEIAGLINIISPDKTIYVWGKEAENYRLITPYWVAIFKVKK